MSNLENEQEMWDAIATGDRKPVVKVGTTLPNGAVVFDLLAIDGDERVLVVCCVRTDGAADPYVTWLMDRDHASSTTQGHYFTSVVMALDDMRVRSGQVRRKAL